ncbi:proteolysis 6 isoform X2 [Wolffia australiana]
MDSDEMRRSQPGNLPGHLCRLRQDIRYMVNTNSKLLQDNVSAILPSVPDIFDSRHSLCHLFDESSHWLQWLMFGVEPTSFLAELSQKSAGQRRVCGAVWGRGDLAYRCRTCEHDPTCAICVPCFQNGNHEGHDYSIIYTGGGCCDCGDVTAWKPDGFCSNHKGADHIQILPEEISDYAGPVLDALLFCWKEKLQLTSNNGADNETKMENYTNELSSMIVKMLLKFCDCCESLLNFVSARILGVDGLLELLVSAELFLTGMIVEELHELLLKLIGEPIFKLEFAKAFIRYYPVPINKAMRENQSSTLDDLLSSFSVQIFTVPSLTLKLVLEENLLRVLFECLWNIIQSCADEEGFIEAHKLANIFKSTVHVVGEIRYVMSHDEVIKYVVCERPDIIDYWFRILGMLQGVDPHKRITGILHADGNHHEALQTPFILGLSLWNIQKHLVGGAFSVDKDGESQNSSSSSSASDIQIEDDSESQRRAKIGRVSRERTVVDLRSKTDVSSVIFPCVKDLILKCMKSLDAFLVSDACKHNWLDFSASSNSSISKLRFKFFRTRKQMSSARARQSQSLLISSRGPKMQHSRFDNQFAGSADSGLEALSVLSITEWPEILFDVSLQEISFHIPLHRFLGFLLHEGMKRCYGNESSGIGNSDDYFMQFLGTFHPIGFSSFVMEHPLRLRVFCAQVRAGMWRRNIDVGVLLSEFYHEVHLFDIGVEADLFLLQCCAALAPPEMFVKRIMERFDLLDYICLDSAEDNEYEPVLLQEMFALLIQIITQRRFCGLSTADNLRHEIVRKLATGDATRSQIVEALPRDLSEDPVMQEVIDTVASYSTPSGLEQGRYSLKSAYWKELDLYDPRWRPRDLQLAEERFFRFCKSSALYSQLPRWTPIFNPLFPLSKIATSKAVLVIIRAVLFHAVFTNQSSRRPPDVVLLRSLHLLSLALDVCEKCHFATSPEVKSSDLLPILSYANEKIKAENQSLISLLVSLMWKQKDESNQNPGDSKACGISSLIESLLKKLAQLDSGCMDELQRLVPEVVCDRREKDSKNTFQRSASVIDRKAKARERQAAILEKMKAQQSKFIASLKPSENESERQASTEDLAHEESTPICSLCRGTDSKSPLCFLVHLQKSRLASFVDRRPPSWDGSDGINNGEGHVERGKPRTGLTVDSREHAQDTPARLLQLIRGTAHEFMDDLQATENLLPDASSDADSILKLEEQMYLSALMDSQDMERDIDFLRNSDESEFPLSSSQSKGIKFQRFGPVDCDGVHISSCGHAVHRECHDLYLSSLRRRNDRRHMFEGVNIVVPEMGELLCPVCRRLANSILPLPQHNYLLFASSKADTATPRLLRAISLLSSAVKMVTRVMGPISQGGLDKTSEITVDPLVRKLRGMYYPNGHDRLLAASGDHLSSSLILWDTLRYSLIATEIASRGRTAEKPDDSLSGLQALYGELQSSNGFILSLLLQVAQASRSLNRRQALVRFCGLERLRASILPHSRQAGGRSFT